MAAADMQPQFTRVRHSDLGRRPRADSGALSQTLLALAVGVLGGTLLGALVGAAIIGLALLAWPDLEISGWVFLVLTVWFAAGGSVLGCVSAVSKVVGSSGSSPPTFEDETNAPAERAVGPRAVERMSDPEPLRPMR